MSISSFSAALKLAFAANLLLGTWYFLIPSAEVASDAIVPSVVLVHKQEILRLNPRLSSLSSLVASETSSGRIEYENEVEAEFAGNCIWIGPLEDPTQFAPFFDAPEVEYEIKGKREADMANPFYRVHTPIFESRQAVIAALDAIRDSISRAGATIDSYIVTTGPLENAISLGLFSQRDNALNVQRILAGLNVNVLVELELRLLNRYWAVVNSVYYIEFKKEIDAALAGSAVALSVSENLCETIAQAE